MQKGLPVNLLTAFGLVVVGSFLPWGSFSFDSDPAGAGGAGAFGGLYGSGARISISAWSSTVSLLGLHLPNWLVSAAAAFLAMFGLMECFPHTRVSKGAKWTFSIYGVIHLVTVAFSLISGGTPGIGYVMVLAAFLAMAVISLRAASDSEVQPETSSQ